MSLSALSIEQLHCILDFWVLCLQSPLLHYSTGPLANMTCWKMMTEKRFFSFVLKSKTWLLGFYKLLTRITINNATASKKLAKEYLSILQIFQYCVPGWSFVTLPLHNKLNKMYKKIHYTYCHLSFSPSLNIFLHVTTQDFKLKHHSLANCILSDNDRWRWKQWNKRCLELWEWRSV